MFQILLHSKKDGDTRSEILFKYQPFPVALFYGASKPNNVDEFLSHFLPKYRQLRTDGVTIEGTHCDISIRPIFCDALARQFLKCIKSHNACNGCERSTVKGEWEGRVVFKTKIVL